MTEAGTTRHRVLVVAMADSVHTARWVAQFRDDPIDVELFPSTPHRRLHHLIRKLRDGPQQMRLTISPGMTRGALPAAVVDLVARDRCRAALLRRRIRAFDPSIVHALEIQHAGYLTWSARRALGRRRVIVTNWGSDIYWYGRFARHRARIEHVLALATDYSAECERDHLLAREFGFRGRHLPVIPNAGGMSLSDAPPAPPSARKTLVIKGYSTFVGRAAEVLRILPRLGADRKSTRLNSSHVSESRMPSSA